MKLYLVARTDSVEYAEFDSFIAVASSEAEALAMHPGDIRWWDGYCAGWPDKSPKTVTLIGLADPSIATVPTVLLASFNVG